MIQKRLSTAFLVLSLILFACILGMMAWIIIEGGYTADLNALYALLLLGPAVLLLYCANASGTVIYIDLKNRRIGRRGWLRGNRFEMGFEDIQQVFFASCGRGGAMIFVIDRFNKHYSIGRKRSYISLNYSQKNLDFIRRAWGGPIDNYMGDFYSVWVKKVEKRKK